MSENEKIRIVFSANDNYVPYLGVVIQSVFDNSSVDREYEIFVLHSGISEQHIYYLKKMSKNNVTISIINVADLISSKNVILKTGNYCKHLSKEAVYRLLVSEIFKDDGKIVYLDCDTVVLHDIAKLYDLNVEGYVLAAVRGNIPPKLSDFIISEDGLSLNDYFNSGVLVINLKEFRESKIGDKSFELFSTGRTFMTMDQDVLNIICKDRVKFIDQRWNVEWQPIVQPACNTVTDYKRKPIEALVADPYIIHYTTHIKPWFYPEYKLAEFFWFYAKKTLFYEEIIFKTSSYIVNNSINRNVYGEDPFSRFVFPWKKVKAGESVVLYGFGVVGKCFIEQIKRTQYCELRAVFDKNWSDYVDKSIVPILMPEKVSTIEFDKIIIAIERQDIMEEISVFLIDHNVPREKIIWGDYARI